MIGRPTAMAVALLAAGCAATNCDPRRADLYSGVACEVGGGYQQRATAQQRELANSRAVALQQHVEADAAAWQAVTAQAGVAERRQRLATLDRQTAALSQRLARARQTQSADSNALQEANARLAAFEKRRAALPDAPTEAQIQELERQRRALADVLTRL